MKGLRKALLIGMTLGVTVLGAVGCMNHPIHLMMY